MKIQPTPMCAGLIGSAGGVVGARTRGVNYTRTQNPHPKNPETTGQLLSRACLSQVVKTWQRLPASVMAAWNTFAEQLPYSGVQAFTKANAAALQAGSLAKVTPTNPDVPSFLGVSANTGTSIACSAFWTNDVAIASAKIGCLVLEKIAPTSAGEVDEYAAIPVFTSIGTVNAQTGKIAITGLTHLAVYLIFLWRMTKTGDKSGVSVMYEHTAA